MEAPGKGTVTQLSSLFPAEEAQRASKRVQETIAERVKELDQLRSFVGDNTSLINLVQKLPEELHHDIMVPFGKAAFFPGRLLHTNEFLVLLGEGYYAERTSKQTIDILKRRGKTLEAQVESLKAVMQDLKAEASFFDSTADEIAEGIVEIREDYLEESSADKVAKTGSSTTAVVEEDEYARMMSRFDELEKEELAAESMNNDDGDDEYARVIKVDQLEKMDHPIKMTSKKEEDECINALLEPNKSECSLDHEHKIPKENLLSDESNQTKEGNKISKDFQSKLVFRQDLRNQVGITPMQDVREDDSSRSQGPEPPKSSSEGKEFVFSGVRENVPAEPQPNKLQAFTGSIVEHTHNLPEQGNSSSKSISTATSKPVSRFKMQRR